MFFGTHIAYTTDIPVLDMHAFTFNIYIVFLSANKEAILVVGVCVSDVISDRKKDLSKMKSLLDILTDPSKR